MKTLLRLFLLLSVCYITGCAANEQTQTDSAKEEKKQQAITPDEKDQNTLQEETTLDKGEVA
ncbi:hypothetical protein ACRTEV_12715 [Rossellomorea arthrocnemi]